MELDGDKKGHRWHRGSDRGVRAAELSPSAPGLLLLPAWSLRGLLEKGLVEGNPVVMWVGLCAIVAVTMLYVVLRLRSKDR